MVSFTRASFVRFLLSGGFNTALTYLLYLILLQFLSYQASYAIAFGSGVLLAYFLSRYFVFRTPGGLRAVTLFPLVYLVQYAAGAAAVALWVERLGLPSALAPLAAIAITIPLTYLLSGALFRCKPVSQDP